MAEFPGQNPSPARALTSVEQHRARLAVASAARSKADCRLLLDILGLGPVANEERRAS